MERCAQLVDARTTREVQDAEARIKPSLFLRLQDPNLKGFDRLFDGPRLDFDVPMLPRDVPPPARGERRLRE
jgi:hypothetical protein